jgi:hypothetical protein
LAVVHLADDAARATERTDRLRTRHQTDRVRCGIQRYTRQVSVTDIIREQIVRLEKNQRVPDRVVVAATFIPALDLDESPEMAQRLLDLASQTRSVRNNWPAQLTSFIGR